MEQPKRERWDIGGTQMESLLTEIARFKGESLWQDAWRRLKANRASWWALIFLAVFGGIAFIAPVLPLPCPATIDLQLEPQPPIAPWTEFGNENFRADYWDSVDRDPPRGLRADQHSPGAAREYRGPA